MASRVRSRVLAVAFLCLATGSTAACSPPDSTARPPEPSTAPVSSAGGGAVTSALPPGPVAGSNGAARLWGVTIDHISNLSGLKASLAALPARPTARVVFDSVQQPADYADAVGGLRQVADLMATPVDSSDTKKYSVDQYTARFRDYLNAFGSQMAIWEVGNEVNGEWTGGSAETAAKTASAFDVVHAAGWPTALTLYYNPSCWSDPANEMLPWAAEWVPERVRKGVDYVFVSYYEADCNNHRPDAAEWRKTFAQLRAEFPTARLGFGEVGAPKDADPAAKAAYLTRYYTMPAPEAGFVGGFFWWTYAEDAVPYASSPVWAALRVAMASASASASASTASS